MDTNLRKKIKMQMPRTLSKLKSKRNTKKKNTHQKVGLTLFELFEILRKTTGESPESQLKNRLDTVWRCLSVWHLIQNKYNDD